MWPSTRNRRTRSIARPTAPPAMTPNFAPDDMCTRSPTTGTFRETSLLVPPMNGVLQFGQADSAKSTRASQAVQGQVGASAVATDVATGTGAASTTGSSATGAGVTGTGAAGRGS